MAGACYGLRVFVQETAIVEAGAVVGEGTRVWHHAHIREGAVIGRDCSLAKNVFVDAGVRIGDRVKIQNNVSVYAGVTLADDVFVGPSAVFTNDRHPRSHAFAWEMASTYVRRGASIGANATVVCPIEIGEWAMVGAGAVVTRDVRAHQLVIGHPARPAGWCCWCGRIVSRDGARPNDAVCECGLRLGATR
ncbi:MAG: UDP-2-acetamido-3-amino-2,3-dideoxy-glucuronate N-acetyltransferase [Actinomycetota bacterium]|nr:UDP-2-acetamido-3-amino-2,3-dideoxy-glucuronate N-acetyltransferase [Actinomycetota bacterium]